MLSTGVGRRYALPLYEIAKSEGNVARFLEELRGITKLLEAYPDYRKLLESPSVALDAKKNSLQEAFTGRLHPYILNFLMLVTEKGRIGAIAEMEEACKELYYCDEGICEAVAVTAVPLSAKMLQVLQIKLETTTGKTVILRNEIDPKIIGGILVRIGNDQLDATVKTCFEELARQLRQTFA